MKLAFIPVKIQGRHHGAVYTGRARLVKLSRAAIDKLI